ncbi:MAG: hypothetical protein ABSE62_12270 [Chthoniobacteraceae bacterium]|jgi:hypothetical protein
MRLLISFLVAAALPLAALAGTEAITASDQKAVQPVPCVEDPLDTVIATSDYGFHQDLKRGDGNIEVAHENFELERRIPINLWTWPNVQCGQWFLRLGADYERFDFSIHDEDRLPGTLQSAAGIVALDYLVNDQTAFLLEARPGVYFQQKVNSGSFNVPVDLAVVYPIFGGDRFYLVAGLSYSMLDRYPVLPIGGVYWRINDKWDLRAYLPNPRLVYECSGNLEFWAGGQRIGGDYRTDNNSAANPAKLSGAVITFEEIRAGAGVTWRVKPLTIDFGAGYTVWSDLDYTRAGLSFETHPAPYVGLTARLDF